MATKEEQVETSEEQSEETSEEFEALTEEETTQKVSELINEQAEEQTEEVEEETEEVEAETEETSVEAPVVDDALVKEYPALKAHYGKPLAELGKHYQSIVVEFNEKSQQITELKKKLAEATIPKLEDEPDSLDHPEENKKWNREREEAIRADERSKVGDKPPQVDYVAEVNKQLPSDVDVNKVIESWSNANAYKLYDNKGVILPEMQLLYQSKPHILVKEVIDYYKLSEQANKTDEEIRKSAHTKSKNDFKKARQTKKTMPKSEVHVVERESTASEDERQLLSIYKIAQEEYSSES